MWPAASKLSAKLPIANSEIDPLQINFCSMTCHKNNTLTCCKFILEYQPLQIHFCKMALPEIRHRPAANSDIDLLQIQKLTRCKPTFHKMTRWK